MSFRKVLKDKASNKWKKEPSEEGGTGKCIGKVGLAKINMAVLEQNVEIAHI